MKNRILYSKFYITLVFSLFLYSININGQTNIGGVINDYEGVVTIDNPGCTPCDLSPLCINEIVVLDASAFSIGDRALIIQMKGAIIDQSNTASGGSITDIGNAGNYEFFEIGNIVGNSIFPTAPLFRTYDTAGLVQLINVPVYSGDVNVIAPLQATPWDPIIDEGGVIALFVEGTLTLNADIDAGEVGYKGVTVSVNGSPDNCSINPNTQFMGPSTDSDKSPKGNGIVVENPLFNGGRSPEANGGGGGVSGDSGGGGGSNFGAGGIGGKRWCDDGPTGLDAGGLGGVPLASYLNQRKVFMGGAGGAGFITNLNPAIATNGGGIVVIRANNIVGNGYTIFAQGANSIAPGLGIDGGGGGGAGGSIAFDVKSYSGTINIDISGGDGQDLGTDILHGPGGGGGGGAFLHNLSTPPANIIINASGGTAGVHNGAQSTNTNGAQDGSPGGIINYYNLVENANNDNGPGGDDFSDLCDLDSDNDGILDSVEDGNTGFDPSQDEDDDGIPNYLDQSDLTVGFPVFVDSNGDGVNDVYDSDGDGIPDFHDLDSDNDGITDVIESGGTDLNQDGLADGAVGTTPTTQGVPSSAGTGTIPANTDGGGTPNHLDLDSDQDGCFDALEGDGGVLASELDGSGTIDIASVTPSGVDANGVPNLVSGGQNDVSSTDAGTIGAECATDITAVNDYGSVTEGIGGTPIANVLINDDLDGSTPTIGAGGVALTQLSTTDPGVTLDTATGAVNVTAGTPAGVYVIEYQICETADLANCDTAFAYVTVISDSDADGIDDNTDLDNDNDGILDTNEGCGENTDISGTTGFISLGDANDGPYPIVGTVVTYDFEETGSEDISAVDLNGPGEQGPVFLFTEGVVGSTGSIDATFSSPISGAKFKLTDFDFNEVVTVNVYDENSILIDLTLSPYITVGSQITQSGNVFTEINSGNNVDGDLIASDPLGSVIFNFYGVSISRIDVTVVHPSASSIRYTQIEYCSADTDGDTIFDYLDTDSDGDGCFDAVEGAGTFTIADLTSSNNLADDDEGSVDANGIPTNAGSPQATTAAVTDNLDTSACPPCDGGTVGSDQSLCWGSFDVAPFTSTTAGSVSSGTLSYQWQISTTDCTTGFTDISGATGETYDHGDIFTTTYFRRVTTNGTDCTEFSNCITVVMNRISIYSTVNNLSCADGPNDGSIDVTIVGTVGAYSVDWDHIPGSPDPEDVTGLAAGDYTVTVTDASGCPATQATLTVGTIENPYAALLLTGAQGATPFPTTDYPTGTFPPDAVVNGEPGGYNQTYPTGTETFDITFDNYYIPEDYIIDPDWAGNASMTYTQDHAGTESGAFFAAGSRITEFSDFGPGAIANNSGNEYYVYGRGLNGFGSTGFSQGWTLTYDFTGLANGYLPAGTLIALTDVDGFASGEESAILNATLASGATTAWATYFDNSLTAPPHGAPIYDSGTNSYSYSTVSPTDNGNYVLITTEDLFNVTVNVTNLGGGSIGLKLAAPLVPIDVTLTGTDNTVCFGPGVDGQIQVDILGNVGPYDIAWDNGTGESGSVSNQTSPYNITNLPIGTYTVTVSSGLCSAQETITLGCPDADNDGISNITDLDDDNDGIPDLVESGGNDPDGDEDGDGIPNYQDTTDNGVGDGSPTDYTDSNGDGIPDVYDFDGDGVPNHLDLDADNDGLYDVVETGNGLLDANSDGQVDGVVGVNGIPDAAEDGGVDGAGVGTPPLDTDGNVNDNPDYLDIDADDDGIQDNIEGQTTSGYIVPSGNDTDGNGVDDAYDTNGTPIDPTIADIDGTGGSDYLDTDSDGDGKSDNLEAYDTDGDNVIDTAPSGSDADGDGLDDAYDTTDLGTDSFNNPTDTGEDAGDFPDDDDPGNEPDWREVGSSELTVTKTITTAGAVVNDVIEYDIIVTNTGNVTITNIEVTDANADGGSISGSPIASLAPGASATVTAEQTITQADIDTGYIENSATATGDSPVGTDDVTDDSDTDVDGDGNAISNNETTESPDGDGTTDGDTTNDPTVTTLTQTPSISTVKSFGDIDGGALTEYDTVGQVINYTITLTNDGNVTVYSPTMADATATTGPTLVSASDIGSDGILSVGEVWTYDATHTVTQADIDNGSYTNTAEGDGSADTDGDAAGDTPVSSDEDETVNADQTPSISTVKSFADIDGGALTEYDTVGQVINYTITLTNDGNVTVYSPTMADATATTGPTLVSASDIGSDGILSVGEVWTYDATHTVTQADIDNGSYTNTAEGDGSADTDGDAAGDTPVSSDEDETVNADQTPSISTVKSFADIDGGALTEYDTVGQVINYTITLTNDGNVTVYSPTMADATATTGPTLVAASDIGSDGILSVGEVWTYDATHTVTQADIDNGLYTNTAEGDGSADTDGDAAGDTPVSSDEDETVNADQTPSISTVKSFADIDGGALTEYDTVGQVINYTITLTNDGNVTVYSPTMADATATTGPTLVSASDIGSDGILSVGEVWTYDATHTVTQADIDNGSYTNTAEGDGSADTDGDAAGDTPVSSDEDETVNADQTPSISTVKSFADIDGGALTEYDTVGQVINYTITLTNDGNVTVYSPTMADATATTGPTLVAASDIGSDGILSVGEVWTYDATHTVTQADIDNGSYTNTAEGDGSADTDGDAAGDTPVSSDEDETVNADQTPSISTVKSFADIDGGALTEYDTVGQVINYTITLTNDGNVTVYSPTMADATATTGPTLVAASDIGSDGILSVGEVWTYDATHTVTQADIDNGLYTNTAEGDGSADTDGDAAGDTPVSSDEDETVNADQTPSISTVKSFADIDGGALTEYDTVGQVINYTITLTNDGNVTVYSPTMADATATTGPTLVSASDIGSDGILSVGEVWTYDATHTVTQADIDNGLYTNTAEGDGSADTDGDAAGDTPVSSDEDETVNADQTPSISTVKSFADIDGGALTEYDTVGQVINYTITLTNDGNVTVYSPTMADATATTGPTLVSASDIGSDGILSVGEVWTYDATHTVTQADIDNGLYTNTAEGDGSADTDGDAAGDTPVSSDEDETVNADQTPSISTVKSFADIDGGALTEYDTVGQVINYTITLTNDGNVTVYSPTMADATATTGPTLVAASDIGSDGILSVGEVWTYDATHTVTQADIDNGLYTNTAEGDGSADTDGDAAGDTPVSSDEDETVNADQTPSISTVKSFADIDGGALTEYDTVGQVINYTITLTNDGNVTVYSPTMADATATTGPTLVSASDIGSDGILSVGEVWTYDATHTVTQADIDNGLYTNTAEGDGSADTDGDAAGDTPVSSDEDETVNADQTPSISTVKSFADIDGGALTEYDTVGQVINYTITLTNDGNVTVYSPTMADATATTGPTLVSASDIGSDGILSVGEVWTYDATHTVTQADIDNGSYTNTAEGDGSADTDGDAAGDTPVSSDEDETVNADQTPDISITKTAAALADTNGDSVVGGLGDTITYSFVVSNTGNVTLSNIVVTDATATVVGGPLASLAVGANDSTTFSATYVITQADIDAGNVTNTAVATGDDTNGNPVSDDSDDPSDPTDVDPDGDGDPDDPTVTGLTQTPDISITKTAAALADTNGDSVVGGLGDTITYSFVVSNTGNVTLSNIVVTDATATVVGGPLASLAVGANDSTTFSATYVITQADIDAGNVTNTAVATGDDTNGNPVSDDSDDPSDPTDVDPDGDGDPDDPTVTGLTQTPDISITKTAAALADTNGDSVVGGLGDTITYSFVVSNTGNVTLSNIVVTDATATVVGGPLASLAVGANDSTTFSATYVITQADIDAGNVTNTAVATGDDTNGNPVSDDSDDPSDPTDVDPDGDGDPDDPTVTGLTQTPDISITKTAAALADTNGDSVVGGLGDTITYSFVVSNTGNVTLSNIVVTDATATVVGGPLASLAVGANDSTTFSATYVITQADIDAGNVTNTAVATGDDTNGNPVSDDSDDPSDPTDVDPDGDGDPDDPTVTGLTQTPDISITKTAAALADTNGDSVVGGLGDTITYSFVVSNTGNVTLSNIVVTDATATVVGGPLASLAVGANDSTTFSATYVITQADIDAGNVTNTAVATGDDTNGNPVSDDSDDPSDPTDVDPDGDGDPDDPTVTGLTQTPDISITKTAAALADTNGDSVVGGLGDTITYSFVVSNTGNVTLSNIVVTDATATVVGGPLASLAVGANDSTTFSATYVITQADIDAGNVTNTAVATGDDTNGNPVSDDSDDPSDPTDVDPDGDGDPDDPTVTGLTQTPDISITKTAAALADTNGDSVVGGLGDTITYSFVVSNTGNVTLSNIVVTDATATVVGGPLASLAVGANDSTTFSATYVITQADIDAGNVTNTAVATGDDTNGNPVSDDSDDPSDPTDVDPDGDGDPDDPTVTGLTQTPDISITKTAAALADTNGDSVVGGLGDTITYSFVVSNTGNVTLSNIVVTDATATVVGGPLASLAVGANDSTTFSATYVITQADIDAGNVTNTAVATGDDTNGNPVSDDSDDPSDPTDVDPDGDGDPDDPTVTGLTQTPDISITKTAAALADTNGDSVVGGLGDTITYSFVVSNTGNVTLSNIVVTDATATVVGGPLASLAVGANDSTTFSATYVITQADIDAGNVTNTAVATGDDTNGNPVSDDSDDPSDPTDVDPDGDGDPDDPTVTGLTQTPDISITKTAAALADTNGDSVVGGLGDTITYSFVVSNTGNVTLSNIVVTDATATVVGGPLASLAVGANDSTTFSATYVITQADIDAGNVTNTAVATGDDTNGNPVSDDSDDPSDPTDVDPDGDGDPDDPTVTGLTQTPDISITKTAAALADTNGDSVVGGLGDTITYSFVVSNTGNVTLSNIVVTDATATVVGGPLASLAVGANDSTTFSATYVITQADIDAGNVTNTAVATGDDTNGNPVSDDSDDPSDPTDVDPDGDGDPDDPTVTGLTQTPDISITKTAAALADTNGDSVVGGLGDTITYSFVVSNTGNVTLSNIVVTDATATVVGGPLASLAVGANDSTTFSATYVITQADIDAGNVTNTAVATGDDTNGNPVSDDSDDPSDPTDVDPDGDGDPDDPTVTGLTQTPDISITKTAAALADTNGDSVVGGLGDTITYSFVVSNTGNVTLSNIVVTDATATVVGGPLASLAVGANDSTTFSATYVITQADIDAGNVTNTAVATGDDTNGNPVSDDSDDPSDPTDVDPDGDGDPDDPTVTGLTQTPDISITKTAAALADTNGDSVVGGLGDTITYSFVVSNTGNVTLSNIVVTDATATVVGGPLASLAVGANDSTTFSATYVITQADIDAGNVTNTAVATGDDTNGNPVSDDSDDPSDPTDVDPDGDGDPDDPTVTGLTQTPDISITKTAAALADTNGDSVVGGLGDTITYSFVVSNTGNVTLSNIVVTDATATVVGGPLASLAVGANDSTTFSATYVITQADIDAGNVTNTAVATGDDTNGNPVSDDSDDPSDPTDVDPDGDGDPDDPTVTGLTQTPDISITKTAAALADTNGDSVVGGLGDTITYSFVVSNTGNVTLSNIVVTDATATVVGGPLASLAVGANDSTTFSATYVITQADIDAGNVTNTAVATGDDTNGNPVSDDSDDPSDPTDVDPDGDGDPDDPTVTGLTQTPDISITKTAAALADTNGDSVVGGLGDTITYSFVVSNTGNVTLSNIVVTDATATVVGGPLASLAVGANDSTTFSATYVITQADIDAGNVTNTAVATGDDTNGNPVSDDSDDPSDPTDVDPDGDGDPDDPTVTGLTQTPDISITKTAAALADTNGDSVVGGLGDTITYSFVVSNTGNVTLSNIVVTDATATVVGGPLASLAVGANDSTTFSATYVITQADIDAGNVTNTAVATGDDTNGNPVSDDSDDPSDPTDVDPDGDGDPDDPTVTGLTQTPDLTLTKTGLVSGDGSVGDIITYTFSVENTGNVTISNIVIDDLLTGSVALILTPNILAPGEIGTATATYTISQDDIDIGFIENSATATGDSPSGNGDVTDISDTGDELVETPDGLGNSNGDPTDDPTIILLIQVPEITLTKTSSVGEIGGSIGDEITYTFSVENTGNVSIFGVTIDDAFLNASGILISPSDLLPGEVGIVTLSYIITQDDVSLGYIENSAVATGIDINGEGVNDISDPGNETEETPDGLGNTNGDPTDDPTVVLLIPKGEEIVIYDAISPDDGDGKNDVFTIAGLQNFPDNNLKIYNRWGVLVFENDAYHLGPFFDGTSNGRVTITKEEKLPSGVYYYVLTYIKNSETISNAGPLYINR